MTDETTTTPEVEIEAGAEETPAENTEAETPMQEEETVA